MEKKDLIIKPNVMLEIGFAIFKSLIIIGVVLFSMWLVKFIMDINMLEIIKEAILNLIELTESSGTEHFVNTLFEDSFQDVLISFIFVGALFFLSTLNRKVIFKGGKVLYTYGSFFLRKQIEPVSQIKDIYIDEESVIGDLAKVRFHIGGDTIEIPYVSHAHEKVKKINEIISSYKKIKGTAI